MSLLNPIKSSVPPTDAVRLLRTASDEVELAMLRGLLEQENIPVYCRDRDSSSYLRIYAGYTMYGTDLYVDEADFDRASELLSAALSEEAVIADEDLRRSFEEAEPADAPEREAGAGTAAKVLVLIAAVAAVIALIFSLGHFIPS